MSNPILVATNVKRVMVRWHHPTPPRTADGTRCDSTTACVHLVLSRRFVFLGARCDCLVACTSRDRPQRPCSEAAQVMQQSSSSSASSSESKPLNMKLLRSPRVGSSNSSTSFTMRTGNLCGATPRARRRGRCIPRCACLAHTIITR
jgi:hypothetical protein